MVLALVFGLLIFQTQGDHNDRVEENIQSKHFDTKVASRKISQVDSIVSYLR